MCETVPQEKSILPYDPKGIVSLEKKKKELVSFQERKKEILRQEALLEKWFFLLQTRKRQDGMVEDADSIHQEEFHRRLAVELSR